MSEPVGERSSSIALSESQGEIIFHLIDLNTDGDNLRDLFAMIFPEVLAQFAHDMTITDQEVMNGVFAHRAQWYGLWVNQQLLAIGTMGHCSQGAFFYNIGVHPQYRGQGYGQTLLKNLLAQCPQEDIYLFVDKTNRVAINLYRKWGFEYTEQSFVPPQGEICLVRFK